MNMQRVFSALYQRIAALVSRGLISHGQQTGGETRFQLSTLGRTIDNVEWLHPFGLVGSPMDGAEAICVAVNGSQDQMVAVVVGDTRIVVNLEKGEVGLVNALGQSVLLRSSGIEITGDVSIQGSLSATGAVSDGAGSLAAIRTGFNVHTHPIPDDVTGPPSQSM